MLLLDRVMTCLKAPGSLEKVSTKKQRYSEYIDSFSYFEGLSSTLTQCTDMQELYGSAQQEVYGNLHTAHQWVNMTDVTVQINSTHSVSNR